ncbi:hypothetical protein ANRL3_00952 [Anaerolineae bacterium]|nr:hypothetical protein ANRL3_00952 [Anaerolineae bacterium]
MLPVSARQTYLNTIGLQLDPFATPVAEQEISSVPSPADLFLYYIPSPLSPLPENKTAFQTLRMPHHSFVYGEPGSGKTTLRLAVEADCRTELDESLAVTYELSDDIPLPLTEKDHWRRLAKAFAIDLFIQVAEQFNSLESSPTREQISALGQQIRVGERHLQRLIQQILDQPSPNQQRGIASYWPSIGKSPVRYVAPSQHLLELIRQAQASASEPPTSAGIQLLEEGLQAARLWGFQRVFVLTDGVDARERKPDAMLALLLPLLDSLGNWTDKPVYFKFFLPSELESVVIKHLPKLPDAPFRTIIKWKDEFLLQLVVQRFRSAGSRYTSLDQLAGHGLKGNLDALILRSSNGSPRRMLRIISSLIDAHVTNAPHEPKFTTHDWNIMRQDWQYEPPLPVAL